MSTQEIRYGKKAAKEINPFYYRVKGCRKIWGVQGPPVTQFDSSIKGIKMGCKSAELVVNLNSKERRAIASKLISIGTLSSYA